MNRQTTRHIVPSQARGYADRSNRERLARVRARDMSAAAIAWLRAAGALALVAAVGPARVAVGLEHIRERPLQSILLGACNLAVPFWLIGLGEHTVASGMTAVLLATTPVLASIGGGKRRGAHMGRSQWLGAAVAYAVGALVSKEASASQSPRERTIVALLVGALLLTIPAALQAPTAVPRATTLLALVALVVVGTVLSFVLLFAAVRLGGAAYSVRPLYLSPAVSLAGAALLLGDPLTNGLALGCGMAIAGVLLTNTTLQIREPTNQGPLPR
jgi:drug/metabolite transporter (DMT)-like permease